MGGAGMSKGYGEEEKEKKGMRLELPSIRRREKV